MLRILKAAINDDFALKFPRQRPIFVKRHGRVTAVLLGHFATIGLNLDGTAREKTQIAFVAVVATA